MSTPIFLLLSFLCLGTLEAFEPLHGTSAPVQDDGSMFYAKSFVDVLRNAVEHKERAHIDSMIADNFLFIGCTKNVDKRQLLAMLNNVPSGAKVIFEFKSSQFIDKKKIEYSVSVSGLGVSLDATFVLKAFSGQWILISGNVPNCPKTRFFAGNPAESIAKSFLTKLESDIASGDLSELAKRFSENFFFHGCQGDYDKETVLGLIATLPEGAKILFTFKSAKFVNGQDVQYTVIATGFKRPAFKIQFVLHKENGEYVLIGGKVPSCPKRHFFLANSAETIAKSFLDSFKADIDSGDASKLAKRISDNFLFKGCHAEYTKQKLLSLFASVPKGSKVSLTFESAQFDNGKDVQYTVTADGLGRPAFEAQFIIHQENGVYVLIGGKVPTCPKRHFYSRFY